MSGRQRTLILMNQLEQLHPLPPKLQDLLPDLDKSSADDGAASQRVSCGQVAQRPDWPNTNDDGDGEEDKEEEEEEDGNDDRDGDTEAPARGASPCAATATATAAARPPPPPPVSPPPSGPPDEPPRAPFESLLAAALAEDPPGDAGAGALDTVTHNSQNKDFYHHRGYHHQQHPPAITLPSPIPYYESNSPPSHHGPYYQYPYSFPRPPMPHSSINHMPYPLDSNRNPYHLQPQYQRHGLVPSQPPHLQNPQLPRPPVFPSNPKSVNGLSQNQVQRESVSTRQLAKGATSESPSPSDTRSVSPTISATSNNAQETTTKRPPRKPLVFVCSICGGISNRKQDLQRHEATHTQIKNYVCPVLTCKFAFVRKDALSRHIKSKHRDLEK